MYQQRRSASLQSFTKQGERIKSKFPDKLWSVVSDPKEDSCLWTESGESILINKGKFTQQFLSGSSRLFRTNNFKSFVRQLNLYGFRKVNKMRRRDFEIWWEYRNENFIRDQPDLLRYIKRKASVDDVEVSTRPVKRRRDPKKVTNVFNLRLAQFDDDPSDESDENDEQENVIDLVTEKVSKTDVILDFLSKNSQICEKQDYLLSLSGDDSCYQIFSDQEMDDCTKEVDSIIAQIDVFNGEDDRIQDYSMKNLLTIENEDKDENNDKEKDEENDKENDKENQSQDRDELIMNITEKDSQEKEQTLSDEPFVINIPLSQKQIWDDNEPYITVSLFPDLPSSQEFNPMLGVIDSSDTLHEVRSHLSFTPTYPLSPSR